MQKYVNKKQPKQACKMQNRIIIMNAVLIMPMNQKFKTESVHIIAAFTICYQLFGLAGETTIAYLLYTIQGSDIVQRVQRW